MANGNKSSLKKAFKKLDFGAILTFVFVSVYCLLMIYILYFGLQTALKDNYDFALDHNIFGLPNWGKYSFSLENFDFAFKYMKLQVRGRLYAGVPIQFVYGLMYAIGSAIANVFAKALPAYFCAKYRTKFGGVLYIVAVVTMILPTVGTTAATIQIMRSLQIYDTYFGILFYNASFWGTYFLVFYAAFRGISNAYAEAAKIDGAGDFSILFKIYIPMVAPSLVAVGIMQFIMFWNDYQVPMLYLPSMPTISYGLYRFSRTERASNAPGLLSACLIVCIPTIVLFAIFKDKIMGNISAGGLKG